MTRQALTELIEAVQAGAWDGRPNAPARIVFPYHSASADDLGLTAKAAFDGSLDAAHDLHIRSLPGWAVNDLSQNGRMAGHPWGIRLAHWDAHNPDSSRYSSAGWGYDSIPDSNPARAWLLAILRALEGGAE